MTLILLATEKSIQYHILYWLTALLPIILGLGITFFLVKFLTKSYKENDDNFDMFDEFNDKNED